MAWRGREKRGAHGSNMQPLCHGNAIKFVIASDLIDAKEGGLRHEQAMGVDCVSNEMMRLQSGVYVDSHT